MLGRLRLRQLKTNIQNHRGRINSLIHSMKKAADEILNNEKTEKVEEK